jgi:hypothetical protein
MPITTRVGALASVRHRQRATSAAAAAEVAG